LNSTTNKKAQSPKTASQRPVDALFDKYSASHQNKANRVINWICIPVIVFALLGFTTAIPFPHLGFLGQYNVYINWTSILIALSIYFYLKVSPVLSYLMLFIEFAMSYGVIQLDEWQKSGGPALGELSLALLIIALTVEFIGQKIEGKRYSLANSLKFQFYGPIWLVSLVLKRYSVKY
jgi:uncharacterized membrane protein YGL010W